VSNSGAPRAEFTEGLVDVLLTAAGYGPKPEPRRATARKRATRV
jgi:hypothetical protein